MQWIWPPFIIIGTFFVPESPWWLVRKGFMEEANVEDQVALIKNTDDLEKSESAGTNYWNCFMGADLRRTGIASVSYQAQCWCGTALMGYSVQFYERAGLSTDNSSDMNLSQSASVITALLVILVTAGGPGFANPGLPYPPWAITEVPSTRLQLKTIVLARNFSNIARFPNNTLMPRKLRIHSWN
ncbi:hypothetical protein QQZ08_007757 [Neonectria magnoliae]|uniref:Major facilitator superfamily (MFS) profile domain-containing protein n=1 Tax=Neonectria magnoliae TaxID=2732573 RepID=A0ABR1HXL2_9HYPO